MKGCTHYQVTKWNVIRMTNGGRFIIILIYNSIIVRLILGKSLNNKHDTVLKGKAEFPPSRLLIIMRNVRARDIS